MLDVTGLRRSFAGRTVLNGIDLRVPDAEIFGFIGANGAGKSTTMRAIMGVLEPDAGLLTWDGKPLDRRTRQRFGYMPEERGLYQKMTVASQVEYFGRLYGLSAQRARRQTAALLERLELGNARDATVQSLSLGNQQRVQLAVALVHDAVLLVLDEPFSGLDHPGVLALSEVLHEKRAEGVSILFSSHQLEIVERLVDSVGIIRGGRMVVNAVTSEARRSADPRLRVSVSGARPGWFRDLPGQVVGTPDRDTIVLDPQGADPEEILDVAMRAGVVEHFGWEQPSLTRLFEEAIAS